MTDHEANIAVAEATGQWPSPGQSGDRTAVTLPDYGSDLNAMHEAEKSLAEYPSRERDDYVDALWEVIQRDMSAAYGNRVQSLLHATAAQRAEAFLRALNIWKD